MGEAVEIMARAISRLVPLDAGSSWNPGHGENFPLNYSEKEKALIRDIAATALSALEREGFVVMKPRTSRNGLTAAQLATLREMSSYPREYHFRFATCRDLVALGLAEPTSDKKRPAHRITEAGRSAIPSPGSKSP